MTPMKILSNLLLLVILALLLPGCSRSKEVAPPPPEELRILSLVNAANSILSELGCKDKIAAVDRHGRMLPGFEDVPTVASGSAVSREVLKKHRINCAIVWYYQQDLAERLRQENIAVITVEPLTLENYPELIRSLGALCGQPARAEELICRYEQNVYLPPTAAEPTAQRVYFELYAPWKSVSTDGFTGQLLKRCNLTFAVEAPRGGTVAPEAVCAGAPEVIFYVDGFGSSEELSARPALRNTPAVRNQRIYAVPRLLVSEGAAPEELIRFIKEKLNHK